jgi:hypothetical protein
MQYKIKDERKARTRTYIQAGSLIDISGLFDLCDITVGDDLQNDPLCREKAETLCGMLLYASEMILRVSNQQKMEKFKKDGRTFLRKRAAQKAYYVAR